MPIDFVAFTADRRITARVFLAVIDNSDPGRTPDFMAWLEKTYGKDITTRTWDTVAKVAK